ncbi:unnamed protein product [Kuraishia capsulata CBS 1993]|uniref:PSP1 C-terminal domain-containing protein n=1 Tax=Kuraishia capsulata CBS 1993 TaxID=1382522 RepID=W6MW50_9ASCO|nr:uncharacterized protein KUCA_T00002864001 [Kuraishia capsulata CBS 1993]CDK26890.1 unnamed protein product [Kuraishia capsulata CBS 1993]
MEFDTGMNGFTDELLSKLSAHADSVQRRDVWGKYPRTELNVSQGITTSVSEGLSHWNQPQPMESRVSNNYVGYPTGLYNNPLSPTSSLGQGVVSQNGHGLTQGLGNGLGQDAFTLPLELQGGVSNISSRRPSYAAEFHNRNTERFQDPVDLSTGFGALSIETPRRLSLYPGREWGDFRPDFRPHGQSQPQVVKLDNGLLLHGQYIVTSAELRERFHEVRPYFGDIEISQRIVKELTKLVDFGFTQPDLTDLDRILISRVFSLVSRLKARNGDLKFQQKNYTLILNKNNKLDIISIPKNSNLQLCKEDLIIVEGDRGKDLAMVLEPTIPVDVAILFNYLKKKLHLKSLGYAETNTGSTPHPNPNANTHPRSSVINEDENFVTLPNKQILRFVKPFEIQQLCSKFNDEIVAHRLCLQYAANLNLRLEVKNVEFQFDKKKLIIYYYCSKRLDFRGLIKELFKVYKTRIWLCAILPLETGPTLPRPQSFENNKSPIVKDIIPEEIGAAAELGKMQPIYFHGKILYNLVKMFEGELLDGTLEVR